MAYILVVVGDTTTRTILSALLDDAGHEVAAAQDGGDGLKSMGRQVPDLVITELQLEGMEGLDFLGRMREIWPSVPVLVILAQARPEVLSNIGVFRPQRRGATGFLDKPILGRELFEAVEAVLAG